MLSGASHLVVTKSTFFEYHHGPESNTVLPTLFKESVQDALHDSRHQEIVASSLKPFPGLEEVIPVILRSINASENPLCAVLLGDHHSNLAYLCARQLSNQLVASFFFAPKSGSDDTSRFFLTIAYQLARSNPSYKSLLSSRLQDDPGLVNKRLEVQFRELIVELFGRLSSQEAQIGDRCMIFVNGLDRCSNPRDSSEILRVIDESRRDLPFRWIFFVTPKAAMSYELADAMIISAESSNVTLGSYKGWKLVVGFSRVDETWTNLPHMGRKSAFISLSIVLAASLFD